MQRLTLLLFVMVSVVMATTCSFSSGESPSDPSLAQKPFRAPASAAEARGRAQMLHEMIHGTLQVVHRDFFDDEKTREIPSASLEDVFHEMARSFRVDIKWLNVKTDVLNADHLPEDDFENEAVDQLAAGKTFHEQISGDRYRFAGAIRLKSQCLKCHVKNRNSTRDRTAGLVISMPVRHTNK